VKCESHQEPEEETVVCVGRESKDGTLKGEECSFAETVFIGFGKGVKRMEGEYERSLFHNRV